MSTSVVRATQILELLAHHEKPMSLASIAETLAIPKSTAYTILRDLVDTSFLVCGSPPMYSIGLKAFEVGAAHLRVSGVVGVAAAELAQLTRALGVTSHYAVLDGPDAVYLCKEDPPGLGVQLASSVGARLPSHLTAVGKACLAWLDEELLPSHVALKTRTATGRVITLKGLKAELASIRDHGYASDDAQAAAAIRCIAAPVFDMSGLKGSIGVAFLRDGDASIEETQLQVKASAARVTQLLGGGVPA